MNPHDPDAWAVHADALSAAKHEETVGVLQPTPGAYCGISVTIGPADPGAVFDDVDQVTS